MTERRTVTLPLPTNEELRLAAEQVTPGLEWLAAMDHYILIGKPPGSTLANAEVKLALCATGDHASRLVSYLAQAQPASVLARLDEIAALREALTPSPGTKAAYIGEFKFNFPAWDEDGNEITFTPTIPWTSIKEIMAAILARADGDPP